MYNTSQNLETIMNMTFHKLYTNLNQFILQAQAHLQTFRSSSAHKKAYDNFYSDRIARKGLHGHGAYESAKN